MPSQITVYVFDIKRKGRDNSDMLSGRWTDTVDPSQGRGYTVVTASIVAPMYACLRD